MQLQHQTVRAEWWPLQDADPDEVHGVDANLSLELGEGEPGQVALHTMVNGKGSLSSYYLSRESAIALARDILKLVALN